VQEPAVSLPVPRAWLPAQAEMPQVELVERAERMTLAALQEWLSAHRQVSRCAKDRSSA